MIVIIISGGHVHLRLTSITTRIHLMMMMMMMILLTVTMISNLIRIMIAVLHIYVKKDPNAELCHLLRSTFIIIIAILNIFPVIVATAVTIAIPVRI